MKFNTLKEANDFITLANSLLGFPDTISGTLTYSEAAEIEVTDEDGNIIETYFEVQVTEQLKTLLDDTQN